MSYTTGTAHVGVKSPTYKEKVVSEQLSEVSTVILTLKTLFAAAHRFVSTHTALAS